MPRHNCSELQRFVYNIDRESIADRRYPEFGPIIWTRNTYGGRGSATHAPAPRGYYEKILDGSGNKRKNISKEDWLRFYRALHYFPVFCANGNRYNAFRWLFFQMYDDSHLYSGDNTQGLTAAPDDATARRLLANEGATAWAHDVPGKYRGYNLALHQTRLITQIMVLNPHTMAPRTYDTFYYHYRTIDGVKGSPVINYFPDLVRVVHQDWRANVKRTSKKEQPRAFQHMPLVFPHVTGLDRLHMVRHYLNGGTDGDNPYV